MDDQVQPRQDDSDDFQLQAPIVEPDPEKPLAAVSGRDRGGLDGVDDMASVSPADPVPAARLRPGQLHAATL